MKKFIISKFLYNYFLRIGKINITIKRKYTISAIIILVSLLHTSYLYAIIAAILTAVCLSIEAIYNLVYGNMIPWDMLDNEQKWEHGKEIKRLKTENVREWDELNRIFTRKYK